MHPKAIKRARALTVLILIAAIAGFAAMPRVDAATPQTVDIRKFAFVPKEITIAPGTTIVWTNHDETPHLLLAKDKAFTSKAMDTDDHFQFTFTREGDFSYFCTMHPFMTGVVHVRK